jgi:Ca-activated chloride channel homolog
MRFSVKRIRLIALFMALFAVCGVTMFATIPIAPIEAVSPSQVARTVGELTPKAEWQTPPAHLYPFRVEVVDTLNETEMNVKLTIQNLSGIYWETAYIALAAPGYEKAIQFEVKDWNPEDIAILNYKFPIKERKERIANLRVVSVTGEQRESALKEEYDPAKGTVSEGTIFKNQALSSVASSAAPAPMARRSNRAVSAFQFNYHTSNFAVGDTYIAPLPHDYNTEKYEHLADNRFLSAKASPLSTFSIDVDRASYANVRSYLENGTLPPKDSIRIEELINYFSYDYPEPKGNDPFSVSLEVADCPWELEHRLVRIGIKGKEIDLRNRPSSNLVFLIDVSGSMSQPNKLPLLKDSLELLVNELNGQDKVSIVVYAGSAGLVLPPTSGNDKNRIMVALDMLQSGGSTAGGQGIELAYKTAKDNFIEGGVNRIILATDGDFNVGTSDTGSLTRLVEEKAKDGIYLSVLGFGRGNLNDEMMETITNKGNGNYAYIDRLAEAQKVLVQEMSGTLYTIAKDVKIQVEFNPTEVEAYRLVGYTNRMMANEDFNDDTKDAGEIGAGHTVTAFYEIVPFGASTELPDIDELKYQEKQPTGSGEMLTVKLRYKNPDEDVSNLIEQPVVDRGKSLMESSDDFIFAASVASFGMLLRDSEHQGLLTMNGVKEIVESNRKTTSDKDRQEFVTLINRAESLLNNPKTSTQTDFSLPSYPQ